jgi:energy-coupling factor transporter ATP-binding protein EcfA2
VPTNSASSRRPQQPSSRPTPAVSRLDKKQRAKAAHSLVEKKYRENLNAKLLTLHNTLQNTQYGPRRLTVEATPAADDQDLDLDEEGSYDHNSNDQSALQHLSTLLREPSSKFRKSEVLDDAMAYVNQTEVEMRHMEAELQRMGERMKLLEKLVKCDDCSLTKGLVGMQVAGIT